MDDVRAGNSHHQVVIHASRQQSKYVTVLLCIILEFSMHMLYIPFTEVFCRLDGNDHEFHFSFLYAVPYAAWFWGFLVVFVFLFGGRGDVG